MICATNYITASHHVKDIEINNIYYYIEADVKSPGSQNLILIIYHIKVLVIYITNMQ